MGTTTDCDVLIVGGGMAGLTAAAYLSRAGRQVVLCEKEPAVGGLVRSFQHNGFTFDGGIRAIENSGVIVPMLRQLGVDLEFLPSTVSIALGQDVVRVHSRDSLGDYQGLLDKHFPADHADIAAILGEIVKVMGYMDVLYGIDNPLFLDLQNDPQYVVRTLLPWLVKYLLTMPKIDQLKMPVDEYLARFTSNPALIDIIAQHFFQKTPTFFALGYFSLYLDYEYPRGGTGALSGAVEAFVRRNGTDIRTDTRITRIAPATREAVDAQGSAYRYRKLIWAADAKTLYRVLDTDGLPDGKARAAIGARQASLAGKVGGDSVFSVYVTADLDPEYFRDIASAHVFYTPTPTGLSQASLTELVVTPSNPPRFTDDKGRFFDWLDRHLALNTYEVSCPALRDPSLAPPGKTGVIVSLLFDYALTRHIEAMGWYGEFRTVMAERIIQVLDRGLYPGLQAAVTHHFTTTPLTLERVSGNAEGAITGWAFTNQPMPAVNKMIKVASSVETPIPDTYQAGQWTFSPAGLPISIMTGKMAADRVLRDLRRG